MPAQTSCRIGPGFPQGLRRYLPPGKKAHLFLQYMVRVSVHDQRRQPTSGGHRTSSIPTRCKQQCGNIITIMSLAHKHDMVDMTAAAAAAAAAAQKPDPT